MTKKELRALYLKKRLSLTASQSIDLSQKICFNLFTRVNLNKITTLHLFLPLKDKNEPDTWLIIDELQRQFPDIRISIPKVNPAGLLESYYFEGRSQLELNAWGIPEPVKGKHTPPESIDMVIVPLLAYDKHGHRVGYGKGYYDRFLKTCRADCQKVGISFFLPEEKIDDTFEGDERLNQVVTSENVYGFS